MRQWAAMVGLSWTIAMAQDGGPVRTPPITGTNPNYISNRDPLAPCPLIKLPIGAIEPRGWLRGQLELMRDGMTGHLPEVSHWARPENNAWLSKDGKGENGWEELPYWLKGYGDLGYVLKDDKITADAKRWMEGVMAAQRDDGYFGSEENRGGGPANMQLGVAGKLKGPDLWPQMPMIDALRSYHEATGDPRVIEFLTRYFKWQASLPKEQLLPDSWQKIRGGDNLASILWLYNRTGAPWLLDLARTIHERTARWSEKIASWHGVNICQGFREPAVFWQVSRTSVDLDAATRNYNEVMGLYGQVPGGMFGADENCRKGYGDPRQAAETCSMVEFMSSFEQLLSITGDGLWADRCEEVAFNSLPAAFTSDYKALHYLTSPNMVQLDKESKAPGLANSGTMISYDAGEVYRCCQHNHAMGWPYFAEHLWMATLDRGLAATLYAECQVKAKVADGVEATITESTAYPFDETIVFTIFIAKPTRFPLYLRSPGWCGSAVATVKDAAGQKVGEGQCVPKATGRDASYIRIDREWNQGDRIELTLQMDVIDRSWGANNDAISIMRGPLWYSLRIGERDEEYHSGCPWPAFEYFARSPWNYGLLIERRNPEASIKVVRTGRGVVAQPFTTDASPIVLQAKARRIPAWRQDRRGLVGVLQPSPVKSSERDETVMLIPMGCARLRITAFPVIGDGLDAHEWVPPPPTRHAASIEHDDIDAVSDGKEPKNSNDHSIPRFTWWDHRGTTEWITFEFDKPRRLSSCSVYWFDDTSVGLCRVPESWRLLYKNGDAWTGVHTTSEFGVSTDKFNAVQFDPVTTTALKIEAKLRTTFSGGILEWRVGE